MGLGCLDVEFKDEKKQEARKALTTTVGKAHEPGEKVIC